MTKDGLWRRILIRLFQTRRATSVQYVPRIIVPSTRQIPENTMNRDGIQFHGMHVVRIQIRSAHDIRRFDIAMNNPILVQKRSRLEDLS